MDSRTITAIATPKGSGGIGIIKISGASAFGIADKLFQGRADATAGQTEGRPEDHIPSHRLCYGHIVDPGSGKTLDEVLLSKMAAGRSYTREDVVEINAHSGLAVMRTILDLVLKHGARLAEPGEFTLRAFLNGRIDLTQAEATIDLINARSSRAVEIAASQIKGVLKDKIKTIREGLLQKLVEIEAAIDFPDESGDGGVPAGLAGFLRDPVLMDLSRMIRQYGSGRVYREGLHLVVVGKPNTGKSSLVNRLLGVDRVIVTDVPGTTRDAVEEDINIRGIAAVIADTAGLHETDDAVEVIGMEKTGECIERADLILFVVDAGVGIGAEDQRIYRRIKDKRVILVCNKGDLLARDSEAAKPDGWASMPSVTVSALYNRGINHLSSLVAEVCEASFSLDGDDTVVPNMRQCVALKKTRVAVAAAIRGVQRGLTPELIALDLQEGLSCLDEILGKGSREDLLSGVFRQFCVGK